MRDAQGPVGRKALGGRQTLQPEDLEGAGKGRASVQGGEATVRLHEGSLPRHREEPGAAVHPVRAEQSVHGQAEIGGMMEESARNSGTGTEMDQKRRGIASE